MWLSAGYQTGFPSNPYFSRSGLWCCSCKCSTARLRELLTFGANWQRLGCVYFFRWIKDGLLLHGLLIFAILTPCVKCIFCWLSCDVRRDVSKECVQMDSGTFCWLSCDVRRDVSKECVQMDSGTRCAQNPTFVFGFQVLLAAFLPTYTPFAKDTVYLTVHLTTCRLIQTA